MTEPNRDKHRIVFVSDNAGSMDSILLALQDQGYEVRPAPSWLCAMDLVRTWLPEIVVTDFPAEAGRAKALYASLKAGANPHIIALLGGHPGALRMTAMAAGADDYIVAPFTVPELLARIKLGIARRGELFNVAPAKVQTADLCIDFVHRRVIAGGREQHLAPKEFELLRCLIQRADEVVPHDQLLNAIQTNPAAAGSGKLRVYIRQLRKKLEPSPEHPRYIRTESRVGYRFDLAGGNFTFS